MGTLCAVSITETTFETFGGSIKLILLHRRESQDAIRVTSYIMNIMCLLSLPSFHQELCFALFVKKKKKILQPIIRFNVCWHQQAQCFAAKS